MAGIGKAIKGLGLLAKKYKKGVAKKAAIQIGKQRKAIRKLPFGKFIDFPLEVATKQKKTAIKTAPIGGAAAAGVAYGERKGKK
jgi:hypothetical protein